MVGAWHMVLAGCASMPCPYYNRIQLGQGAKKDSRLGNRLWARVPKGMLCEGLEPLHPTGVFGPYHPLLGTWQKIKIPIAGIFVGARGLEPPDLTDVNRAL